jgi:hypothetical protein
MERTARIPVFESTKRRLLSEKLKKAAALKRNITWDKFLLEKCCQ